jgi:hypothetical protein
MSSARIDAENSIVVVVGGGGGIVPPPPPPPPPAIAAMTSSGGRRSSRSYSSSNAFAVAASIAFAATFAILPHSTTMMTTTTTTTRRTECESSSSHRPHAKDDVDEYENIEDEGVRPEMAGEDDDDDDDDDDDGLNGVVVRDGMDAGGRGIVAVPPRTSSTTSSGPANAEEDDDDADDESGEEEVDDEETTCSICLINRQGPCRNHWLKFERCMKEHGREKEDRSSRTRRTGGRSGSGSGGEGSSTAAGIAMARDHDDVVDENRDDVWPSMASMEGEWDAFMERSTTPGEDEDEEEEEEEVEDDEVEDDIDDARTEPAVAVEDSSNSHDEHGNDEDDDDDDDDDNSSLAERCDKFMIPWIGCIQEHRNAYTLISNAFYRDDMIRPLESTIRSDMRLPYPLAPSGNVHDVDEIDDVVRGYVVVKYHGVEIDLGNWKEHVDADIEDDDVVVDDGNERDVVDRANADVANRPIPPASNPAEPHLINAVARFRLVDPSCDGRRPIEVAYVMDQNGTLLGFDSFAKAKRRERAGEGGTVDDAHDGANASDENDSENETMAGTTTTTPSSSTEGECSFHIVPGETTSIVAYAIYRGTGGGGGDGDREDVLYYTPEIPLPKGGAANAKKLRQ